MADIFCTRDAVALLQGKKVVFLGDSNVRALYKDVVCLLVNNRLMTDNELKKKGEASFLNDRLLEGSKLTKGRDYKEYRRYMNHANTQLDFRFITKCLNHDIMNMLADIREKRIEAPDIIVMNSTLWDLNRWGWYGVENFKDNMHRLMSLFQKSIPKSTLVIWVTAPPLAVEIRGGYMIKQLEYSKYTMRFHVMEANLFAQRLLSQNGYNVLDFHFHLRWQVHRRRPDGLHWSAETMRHLTNLLLTHIALALKHPLPGRFTSLMLEQAKAKAMALNQQVRRVEPQLPEVPRVLLNMQPQPMSSGPVPAASGSAASGSGARPRPAAAAAAAAPAAASSTTMATSNFRGPVTSRLGPPQTSQQQQQQVERGMRLLQHADLHLQTRGLRVQLQQIRELNKQPQGPSRPNRYQRSSQLQPSYYNNTPAVYEGEGRTSEKKADRGPAYESNGYYESEDYYESDDYYESFEYDGYGDGYYYHTYHYNNKARRARTRYRRRPYD